MAPKSNALNQVIAIEVIEMIFKWLPRAYRDGGDMHWCGWRKTDPFLEHHE